MYEVRVPIVLCLYYVLICIVCIHMYKQVSACIIDWYVFVRIACICVYCLY